MFFVSTNPRGEQDDYSSPTSLKYSFEKISHGFQSEDRPDTHSAERPPSSEWKTSVSLIGLLQTKKLSTFFICVTARVRMPACVRGWVGALRARDRMYVEVRG